MMGGGTLPKVPESGRIPAMMGELAALIAEANRKNGGRYCLAYNRGRWIELKFWNGETMESVLPMDTRITEEALTRAMRAVKQRFDN